MIKTTKTIDDVIERLEKELNLEQLHIDKSDLRQIIDILIEARKDTKRLDICMGIINGEINTDSLPHQNAPNASREILDDCIAFIQTRNEST